MESYEVSYFQDGERGNTWGAYLLLQYARVVCLVSVGHDWTPDVMEAAVTKGPHS